MAYKSASAAIKSRVILSVNHGEAKSRVRSLYKAWYRQIPYIVENFDFPITIRKCKVKLKEEFTKHDHVCDVRIIDMLVIQGHMLLKEATNKWMTKKNLAWIFAEKNDPTRKNFVAKFLDGEA